MNRKVRAANVSVGSNLVLVVAKLVVGQLTGSVSVMSEAVHSAIDVAAALILLLSVRVSSRPADREHSYGHGKVENLSALVGGVTVLSAAAWILYEVAGNLLAGPIVPLVGPGLWVMGISALVNWLVSAYLVRVAREEDSQALAAEALNWRVDIWTSVGVFGGLLLVKATGIPWLDPVFAALVAAMILKSGWGLCVQSLTPLVDARLPEEEEEAISRLIERHSSEFVEFHDLRTRRAGADRHVDFHLVVHRHWPLEEVHRLCDQIETAIAERFPLAQVLIHPEPCEQGCEFCQGQRERRVLTARPHSRRFRPRGSLVRRRSSPEFAD